MKNWGNFYFNTTLLKATASVVDGVYVVNITNPGTANWHIVDQQGNISLSQGVTYKVTFDAWSENPNTMDVFLAENHDSYVTYYSITKGISATKQNFTWTFTMSKASDPNCRFGFGFGRFIGKVYIDNVSLEKVTATQSETLTTSEADAIDVFPNPTSGILEITSRTSGKFQATIKLYNLQGQLVLTLCREKVLSAGMPVRFNLNNFNIEKGVYLLTVSTPERIMTRKVVIN